MTTIIDLENLGENEKIEKIRLAFVDQISKGKYKVFDGVTNSTVVFDEKAIHHAMKVALGSNICGNDF